VRGRWWWLAIGVNKVAPIASIVLIAYQLRIVPVANHRPVVNAKNVFVSHQCMNVQNTASTQDGSYVGIGKDIRVASSLTVERTSNRVNTIWRQESFTSNLGWCGTRRYENRMLPPIRNSAKGYCAGFERGRSPAVMKGHHDSQRLTDSRFAGYVADAYPCPLIQTQGVMRLRGLLLKLLRHCSIGVGLLFGESIGAQVRYPGIGAASTSVRQLIAHHLPLKRRYGGRGASNNDSNNSDAKEYALAAAKFLYVLFLFGIACGLCWRAVWLLWYRDSVSSLIAAVAMWCAASIAIGHGLVTLAH
jgi:hypothetical protein